MKEEIINTDEIQEVEFENAADSETTNDKIYEVEVEPADFGVSPDTKREMKSLEHFFTAIEMVDMAQKVGEIFRSIEAEKAQAKAHAAAHKANIEEFENEFAKLSNLLADKKEIRDVKCAVEYNIPTDGMKTYTRLDNGLKFAAQMDAHEWNLFNQKQINAEKPDDSEVTSDDILEIEADHVDEFAIIQDEPLNVSDVPEGGENFQLEEGERHETITNEVVDEFGGSFQKPSEEEAYTPPKNSRRKK